MKKLFCILFLALACIGFASAANFNFSTFGNADRYLSSNDTTLLENYSVKTGATQVAIENELLFFDNGKPAAGNNFYSVVFSPPLSRSIFNDLRNRTYFKWRGAQYVLMDFDASKHKLIYGIESNYTNANLTYSCNFSFGGYTVNVSEVDLEVLPGQSVRRAKFDFIKSSAIHSSITVGEGEIVRNNLNGYIVRVLKIVPGTQKNTTFVNAAFYSKVNVLQLVGNSDYYCGQLITNNDCETFVPSFDSSGALVSLSHGYERIFSGTNVTFSLLQDCAYMPEMACKSTLTRVVNPTTWTAPAISVVCPANTPTVTSNGSIVTNTTPVTYSTYCFNSTDCFRDRPCESYACSGTSSTTVNITIGNNSGNTSKICVYTNLTGCVWEGACVATGYRATDIYDYWYCNGSLLLRQKNASQACTANYQCISNSCVSGSCSAPATPTPVTYPTPTASPVISTPPPTPTPKPPCSDDVECNDNLACTSDKCIEGKCEADAIPGCALGFACKEYGSIEVVSGKTAYCGLTGEWLTQKPVGANCTQNYECSAYNCLNFQCLGAQPLPTTQLVTPIDGAGPLDFIGQLLKGIADFFGSLFGAK